MNKESIMSPMKRLRFGLAVVLAAAAPLASALAYDLPLFADELDPGERFYTFDHAVTTTQKFGYDITARRLDGGSWTSLIPVLSSEDHWKNPKNSSYFFYGKPFYAMQDGTIISCWRNAPQNPRPKLPDEDNDMPLSEKGWIHQNLKDGLIPGGGNQLWILHDDGTRALYAHAQTGSIRGSVPQTGKVRQGGDMTRTRRTRTAYAPSVAAGRRKRRRRPVPRPDRQRGLDRPRVHIHLEKKNRRATGWPKALQPRNVHAVEHGAGHRSVDQLFRPAITKGEVLFWLPTREQESARHKAYTDSFQRVSITLPIVVSSQDHRRLQRRRAGLLNHIWEPARFVARTAIAGAHQKTPTASGWLRAGVHRQLSDNVRVIRDDLPQEQVWQNCCCAATTRTPGRI
jgi:hypothetical protein